MNENDLQISSARDVIDDDNEYLFKILGECNRWNDIELELTQNRSNFQIEKFIIHDSYTLPSAFKTAIMNRKSVAENLMGEIIEAKKRAREFFYKWEGKDKTEPIWWKNRAGGETLCWYDIDEFEFDRFMEIQIFGFKSAIEELQFFDKIISRLIELNGGPVTREQYINDQPTYWERRLSSQALDEILGSRTGVNAGNIRSMRRASSPTVLEDDLNRIKGDFGDPKNPVEFLNKLQKSVADGIHEICGLEREFLPTPETSVDDSPKKVRSLFNQELIQENA